MPLSHQYSPMDVVRLDLGRDRAQDQVLAQEGSGRRSPRGMALARLCVCVCASLFVVGLPAWVLPVALRAGLCCCLAATTILCL